MSRTELRLELGEIRHNLRQFDDRANEALSKIFTFQEPRSEAYLKSNAPWTDRTTNARSGLWAKSFESGNEHLLVLSHTVAYGIFLETIKDGKYAVIVPAWLQATEEIWRTIRRLFDVMDGG